MQLSYELLSIIANSGDHDAQMAMSEYMSLEREWAEAHEYLPYARRPRQQIEIHFAKPDLFMVCTTGNTSPVRHTLQGIPMQSRMTTVPGIPLPRISPVPVRIINKDK